MKKRFYFKEGFYSFVGGTIASLSCTILYDTIDQIGNIQVSIIAYIFAWISWIMMCISCGCLLWLASSLGNVEAKFNKIADTKKDANELWFRAIRAIAENKIQSNNRDLSSEDLDTLIERTADKMYYKLIILLIIGCLSLLLGFLFLILSKVV